MVRLSDLVKGGGEESSPPGTGKGTSRKLGDLIRRPGKPAPPGPDEKPPEGGPPEAGPAPVSQAERTEGGPPPENLVASNHVLETAVAITQEIHQAVRAHAPLPIAKAEQAVERLLESLAASDALLVPFFSGAGPTSSPAREAVNVCILSMKSGVELGYAHEQLRKLSLAALLCDIGMTRVPAQILGKQSALSSDERAVVENHQREGPKLLQPLGPEYRWLAEVVEKRYTKAEGARQAENETEEHAAIIHLADVYESLIHDRPFRSRLGSLEALKEILRQERKTFPDRILKALVRAMSAFPAGSLVLLNSGEIGRVVAKNKNLPLRPVVEVRVRRGKRLAEPVVIDLSQSPLHHIQDSVGEDALP